MTTTFETARVGDKVWCMHTGWGEIIDTWASVSYPIAVYFPNEIRKLYTTGGYYVDDDVSQTLFWDVVKVVAPQKPLPNLEVDTKVIVWTNPYKKQKRHFSHFVDGRIWTFDNGSTSFSKLHTNSVTGWPHWELAE